MSFGWLELQVTPPGFDAAFGLIVGGLCSIVGIISLAHGYWRSGFFLLLISTGPLRDAWRYYRQKASSAVRLAGE